MALQNFIVFEGIDGAGTTTQLDILRNRTDFLKLNKDRVCFTAEPTSSPTGKYIRTMLKGDVKLQSETAAFLFSADRNEHINGELVMENDRTLVTGVKKACEEGRLVISDRYFFSSLAYQSIDSGWALPSMLNSTLPLTQLLFYFEIEPEVSLKRITGRGFTEIYEKESFLKKTVIQYHKALEEYSKPEKNDGMKVIILDATRPKEEISTIIWNEIKKLPIIQG